MKTPHKHAELIKAWADGADVQYRLNGNWYDCGAIFNWSNNYEYRIKPEKKPDVVLNRRIAITAAPCEAFPNGLVTVGAWPDPNLKLTFDAETGRLKAAELL